MTLAIRRARPDEAEALTALALRSKANWGYDAAFLRAASAAIRITAEDLDGMTAFVAERDDRIVGFYVLGPDEGVPTLRDLWIEPAAMGGGIGRALFAHMLERARGLGHRIVTIESDPNAEPFYLRMGARRVGERASKLVPGRVLPLLEVET